MGEPKIEPISFGGAMVLGRSPLILKDGELISAIGHTFDIPGQLSVRDSMTTVNTVIAGSINGMHRYINNVFLTDSNVRYKWDLDGYCGLYTPANGDFTSLGVLGTANRSRWTDAENFTFMVNGYDKKAFSVNKMFTWGIENPIIAPYGVAGSSGNPSGTYTLYYTYFVKFPNGTTYETGPSPAFEMSAITSKMISWSNIGLCPYEANGLIVYRKLYRYSTTLGDVYYVATIKDNTTTAYTDDLIDATVLENDPLITSDYGPPPDGMVDITTYLFRIFGVKDDSVYYSEPYMPFTFNFDSSLSVTNPGEMLKSCIAWGDQLYLGWPRTWRRLQGINADTWQIKNTFSEQGPINTNTTKKTRYGILFQWYDGLYVFDGTISRNITEKDLGTSLFKNITNPTKAYAEFDGVRYWFVYPSTGTTLDSLLILDFQDYPQVKFYKYDTGFIPSAYEYHFPTGIKYFGKTNGYQYKTGGSETIVSSLQTGDRALGSILRMKNTERLYYDIMTGGHDVIVTIYADGVACSPTYTLNESSRVRSFINLGNHSGYRFSIKIDCSNAADLIIYEPWGLSYVPYGG